MSKMAKQNQPRVLFVVLGTAIILVVVWVTWKPATLTSEVRAEPAKNVRWWYPLPPFVEPTPRAHPVRPPATVTSEVEASNVPSDIDIPIVPSPIPRSERDEFNSLTVRTFSPAPINFKTLAVVDVDRLLIAYPPGSDSKEERSKVLADIQRAVTICASVHDFAVVFDRTGKSLNGVPTVLIAADPFDLTDEVAQQLAYLRPADSIR